MYFVYIISVCVVKSKIYSHRKNISSNHLFSNFSSKNVAFTCVRVNFRNKHTVLYCKLQTYFEKKFAKLPDQILLYSDFTKYFSCDTNSRFSKFDTTVWKSKKFSLTKKYFVKSTL